MCGTFQIYVKFGKIIEPVSIIKRYIIKTIACNFATVQSYFKRQGKERGSLP